MSKKRTQVRVTKERPDHECELNAKKLTDEQIKANVPAPWKRYAENANHQISVPIPGSQHST